MITLTKLREACLATGVAAMTPNSKDTITARYIRAQKAFCQCIKNGDEEISAFMYAMFSAAKWDLQEYSNAMRAVNKTLGKQKRAMKK